MNQLYRYGVCLLLGAFLFSSIGVQIESLDLDNSKLPISENLISSSEDAASAAAISSIALYGVRNILRQAYERPITQLEITNHIDSILRSEGSDGELSFPSLVMTRDEFNWPYGHSNDDADHILDPSQEPVVTIRAGARVNGQCVDVYRTFFFDSVSSEIIDAYSAVLTTEIAVINAIEPGVSVAYLDGIVGTGLGDYIGLPNITYSRYWGHGVGEFVIVEPLLSYETEPMSLSEGQLLGIQIWLYHDDGWFVRVEDTVVVTSTGVEVLSDAPKQLANIMIHSSSPDVEASFDVQNYGYGNETTISATIVDDAHRTISSVHFFDGKTWQLMHKDSAVSFSHSYLLDYSYPSFIRSIVRIKLSDDTIYITNELNCEVELTIIYEDIFDTPIKAVVEQVLEDGPFRYIFTNYDAEMLRLNFYNLYPPPGDQFLVRDGEGNVVYEYKWNLGEGDVSPWIPGNIVYVDIISTWRTDFGGVNHFYFTVDMMWVFDSEATSSTTTETTDTSVTTTTTTGTLTDLPLTLDPTLILIAGIFCAGIGFIGVYLKRR
ncbi:M24 family metallopeptidase [Candidatus Thorarchaeota archaeon]|nr:MAG: M24 family metallopeptidase [Candidatus Thorarchaeota archaeon]